MFRVITPAKNLDAKWIRFELLNAIRVEGTKTRRLFRMTTANWEGDKPKFTTSPSLAGGTPTLNIMIDGTSYAVSKWHYLDKGTHIRWAVMGPGFSPKTSAQTIVTKPGSSDTIIRGKTAMMARGIPPRPGIKARAWTDIIAVMERPSFVMAMRDAVKKGAKKTGFSP